MGWQVFEKLCSTKIGAAYPRYLMVAMRLLTACQQVHALRWVSVAPHIGKGGVNVYTSMHTHLTGFSGAIGPDHEGDESTPRHAVRKRRASFPRRSGLAIFSPFLSLLRFARCSDIVRSWSEQRAQPIEASFRRVKIRRCWFCTIIFRTQTVHKHTEKDTRVTRV